MGLPLDSFEHVFDPGAMSSARSVAALDPGRPVVEQLRERVAAMERRPAGEPVPTLPGLADLVPLHAGATYAVDSASLALALAAGASRAGEWVGFAGLRRLRGRGRGRARDRAVAHGAGARPG